MADIKVLFGNRVRELRRSHGWSQEQFAQRIGLDRSYMGGVERGERNVSLENITLIVRGLGMSLSDFFDFERSVEQEGRSLNQVDPVERRLLR